MGWHSPYKPKKFEVGEQLLALRTRAKLTQAELAGRVGTTRRTILSWEAGASYPQEDKLRLLISLFLAEGALTAGQEYEQAVSLWQLVNQDAPRKLARFNEEWFASLLSDLNAHKRMSSIAHKDPVSANPVPSKELVSSLFDWGEAIDVPLLYGREAELATLCQWVINDRCRVVALLGLGGIGKTSLAVALAREANREFDIMLFRSLRNAPSLELLLDDLIQLNVDQQISQSGRLDDKITQVVQFLRKRRCLLILDNLETILEAQTGDYRTGYTDYGRMIQQLGEVAHQSCLLLTSREKPMELVPLEGRGAPVRTLILSGLADDAGKMLLQDKKDVFGTDADYLVLMRLYGGNPLALKLISEPIREVFGGNISTFLLRGHPLFNGVGELLHQHFNRSTPVEQAILYWLALAREWVPLDTILEYMIGVALPRDVMGALESLRRRFLIERGEGRPAFTLQPVIMEYVTDRLVEQVHQEIMSVQPALLHTYVLLQAMVKEYVRHSQERLVVVPLLERLVAETGAIAEIEWRLLKFLDRWRGRPPVEQGYGPGNVVNLLRLLRGHLCRLDLEHLAIRQAHLQGVDMQDSSLAHTWVQESTFTEAMGIVHAVAASASYWAVSSRNGMVQVWRDNGRTIHLSLRAHDKQVITLAFSPTTPLLASGSYDCTIKLWDMVRGVLVCTLEGHTDYVQSVAFSPDGAWLASASDDQTVRIWEVATGHCLQTIHAHRDDAYGVAWSPDGHWVVSCGFDQRIHIWDVRDGSCVQTFAGHTHRVSKVAFAPDGHLLASGGFDQTVRIWEVATGHCLHTLAGHCSAIKALAWSADGQTVASSSYDSSIRLWSLAPEMSMRVLQAHTASVNAIAFTPNGNLISGSDDHTVRVWDVASGWCVRLIEGYGLFFFAVVWSPDSRYLLSANSDATLALWHVEQSIPMHILRGHTHTVYAAGWSPDGKWFSSGGYDQMIRIWDANTRGCVRVIKGHSDIVYRTVWHPGSHSLASASRDQTVRLWNPQTGQCLWIGRGHTSPVNEIAWSPDGQWLASCSEDQTVRIWRAQDGTPVRTLGHGSSVAGLAWSPDGRYLASCGGGGTHGELQLWDAASGAHLHTFAQPGGVVFRVAWSPDSKICLSGGITGAIQWWDVANKVCLQTEQAHQGWIRSLKVSPDGTTLVSSGEDGVIHLWDMANAIRIRTLRIDRPYERLDITSVSGLTGAQRASLLALGAIERSN